MPRPVRTLFAWLAQEQAVVAQLERQPRAGEDLTVQVQRWEVSRQALNARPAYQQANLVLEALPETLRERAEQFRQNPDTRSTLRGLDWELGIVDLRSVLSFQFSVTLERINQRLGGVQADQWNELFSLCLPDIPSLEELRFASQIEERAFTISTTNPNLRILAPIQAVVSLAPDPSTPARNFPQVGFAIDFGTPFVQIVEFQQRWFVRDGYHRCYGLMQRGIYRIPCVFVRARDFSETGANRPGFVAQEALLGAHPPLVSDFLDDAFAINTQQPSMVKVVRVVAQEFAVNSDDQI
jgi:hypothetical protein